MKQNKKLGLALGSGGPKGLAHVGVIRELIEQGFNINYIAGTSIGAWVGAHYALFQDVDLLEEYTVGKRKEKAWALLDLTLKGGIVKGEKVRKFLRDCLNDADFRNTKIPFRAVATDIVKGKTKIFSKGKIVPAVQASMCIPALFKPVEVDGKYYVDGGLADPVPDDVVKKMGADVVLSVNLDNCLAKKGFNLDDINSVTKVSTRAFLILRHYLAKESMQYSDFILQPRMPYYEPSLWKNYFTGKIGQELVNMGRKEVKKIIPKLREALK